MNVGKTPSRSFCYFSEALESVIGRLSKPSFPVVTTGFSDLDLLLRGGFPVGSVSAVAGRPHMGREEFARHVAFSAARQGEGVLYFSLEHSRHKIALHGLAEILDVAPHWLSTPSNQADALSLLEEFSSDMASLSDLPMIIDDTPALKPDELRERVVSLCRSSEFLKTPVRLLIVDSLACLHADPHPSADVVKPTLAMLSDLAKSEGIHILCTVPVLKEVDERDSHVPKLFDLWGDGMVERYCDPVIGIYRERYYIPAQSEDADDAQIIVLRNSMPGVTGSTMLSIKSGRFFSK